MSHNQSPKLGAGVVCVALNPAVDLTIEVSGLRIGEVNRAQRAQQDAGGKGINVASCLADYAVNVAVTGQLGRENPALFESLFEDKGIGNHCLYIDGHTRVNTKVVDPAKSQTTDINLPGAQLTAEQIDAQIGRLTAILSNLSSTARWVVLSGSLPPGWPPDTYATLTRHVHAFGGRVMLDTSGLPFTEALKAVPDIVKPNREELAEHLGRPLPDTNGIIEGARNLLRNYHGMSLVVVSMGSAGAVFVSPAQVVVAHPLEVEPISSVGAGDAMVAGIVAAHLQALSLEECARLATAFAAGKLTRLGPHLPKQDLVQALAKKVRLTQQG
jgi:1-phosphofructokinase